MFQKLLNKKKAVLRRKLKHERLSIYKAVKTVTFEQRWADAPYDYIAIVFKENGYGERKVEIEEYWHKKGILTSEWWASVAVPWLNHLPPIEGKSKKQESNIVKLELVKS